MLLVMFHPKAKEVNIVIDNIINPTTGPSFSSIVNYSKVNRARGMLRCSDQGRAISSFLYMLDSERKATIEPVKVTPPINVPKNAATVWNRSLTWM